ncbi:hypothetical protein MTO96_038981, partial [Rhipicephalus appendiculatus]
MMCSSTCARAEEARLERLTTHGCATVCRAVEKDVAANPAVWDRNFRGPGSGHYPRRPNQVGLVHKPGPGYCTLTGAAQQASSLDLGSATGTGPWNVHDVVVEVNKPMNCYGCGVGLSSLEKYVEHHIGEHKFAAEYVQQAFHNDK